MGRDKVFFDRIYNYRSYLAGVGTIAAASIAVTLISLGAVPQHSYWFIGIFSLIVLGLNIAIQIDSDDISERDRKLSDRKNLRKLKQWASVAGVSTPHELKSRLAKKSSGESKSREEITRLEREVTELRASIVSAVHEIDSQNKTIQNLSDENKMLEGQVGKLQSDLVNANKSATESQDKHKSGLNLSIIAPESPAPLKCRNIDLLEIQELSRELNFERINRIEVDSFLTKQSEALSKLHRSLASLREQISKNEAQLRKSADTHDLDTSALRTKVSELESGLSKEIAEHAELKRSSDLHRLELEQRVLNLKETITTQNDLLTSSTERLKSLSFELESLRELTRRKSELLAAQATELFTVLEPILTNLPVIGKTSKLLVPLVQGMQKKTGVDSRYLAVPFSDTTAELITLFCEINTQEINSDSISEALASIYETAQAI